MENILKVTRMEQIEKEINIDELTKEELQRVKNYERIKKCKSKNMERTRYLRNKGNAKSFIRIYATIEDLEDLKKLCDEYIEKQLKGDHIPTTGAESMLSKLNGSK